MVGNPPLRTGHPRQAVVVEHERLAVRRQLHIQFDAVAVYAGGLERSQGILRRAIGRPQTPVGDRRIEQPLPSLAEALGGGEIVSQASSNLHNGIDFNGEVQRQAIDADR